MTKSIDILYNLCYYGSIAPWFETVAQGCCLRQGVDVGEAVELVTDSLRKLTNQVILLSSDTDLIPALIVIKQEGAEIIYLAFEDQITKAIAAHANSTHVIRRSELVEAYDRVN